MAFRLIATLLNVQTWKVAPSYIAGGPYCPVYADQLQVYVYVPVQYTRETALSQVIPIVVARPDPALCRS